MRITLFVILLVVLTGCGLNIITVTPEIQDEDAINESRKLDDNVAVIELCNSLCEVDEQAYCSEIREATLDGENITGTCDSFSTEGPVPGFQICDKYCNNLGQIE